MKLIVVGLNPSSHKYAGGKISPTFKRLERWMSECGVKHFSFVNSFDYEKSSPEAKDADLEKLRVCSTGYTKVLALGGFASSALNKLKIHHERLPHPSPRNRQFNDPAFEPAVVRRISEYLSEK